MRAAFYKGTRPGIPGLYNHLGRYLDGRGKYSHTEHVFTNRMSASSSFEDKGVRFKDIGYSSGNWDFLLLPTHWEAESHKWYSRHAGEGYDLIGQIKFGFGFVQAHEVQAWFCSESNIASVACLIDKAQPGAIQPHRYGPNGMYELYLAAGAVPCDAPWEGFEWSTKS